MPGDPTQKKKDPPVAGAGPPKCLLVLLREESARLCHSHAHHLVGECNLHVERDHSTPRNRCQSSALRLHIGWIAVGRVGIDSGGEL